MKFVCLSILYAMISEKTRERNEMKTSHKQEPRGSRNNRKKTYLYDAKSAQEKNGYLHRQRDSIAELA